MSWQATTAVTRHSKHSGSELLCLLMLANYADSHGESIRPSITSLAADCRMSRRGVQYIMAKLIESGELVDTGEQWSNNVKIYRIVLPDLSEQAAQTLRSPKKQAVQSRTQAVQNNAPSCATAIAQNQYDQSEKDLNEKIPVETNDGIIAIERWKVNQGFVRNNRVFFADGTEWTGAPEFALRDFPVRP